MIFFPHTTQALPRRHGVGLWSVAFAFLTVLAFSTVPTPLYAIYQERDGFSTFMITVVYAAYAVGVVLALFFAGHVSDWLGRRRTLVPAMFLTIVSAIVFLTWPELPGLLVARVLNGLSVGVVTATATAYVSELYAGHRPDASPKHAQIIATSANLGGLGLGPIVAGVLAQFVRSPLTVPFIIFAGLLAVATIAVGIAPETVTAPTPRPAYRPQRVAVPVEARAKFLGAGVAGFVSYAAFGLFASLAPTFLAGTLHDSSHLLAGVPTFAAFAGAVAAQFATWTWDLRRLLKAGMSTLAAGIVLVLIAAWVPSLALFLIGGVISGAGGGLLFKGGVLTAGSLTSAATRAEIIAGFFLASYIGISVPVVGLGILVQVVALKVALLVFVAALLIGIASSARILLGGQRNAKQHATPVAV
jgi:MFS family permease